MTYVREAEFKLLERTMALIERAFKLVHAVEEREQQQQMDRQMYLARKARYEAKLEARKQKQGEKT